ncbi:MAG: cache domain-containing protein [Candidatus Delongbacteria bacterium]|nr:cache domain-containing protein [Candidatus Delongbacteria bacterium]
MKTSEHADRTEKLVGIRAEDIHKWIDGFFDFDGFEDFLRSEKLTGYDPYDHRKFRHCIEALDEAYQTFADKYTKEQIKAVFESHIKDDYNGYIPHREDFENGTFTEHYHENDGREESESILSETELSDYFKGKFYTQSKKKNKKITTGFQLRIVLPTILAIILFVSSVFTVILPVFRSNMLERKKEMIKELTAAAISVIEFNIDLEKKGTLTREEAQNKSIIEIEAMRYGDENKDYFWITDMYPRMVMHPYRTDLKGQDLSDFKDVMNKSGKYLFVEFVKIVKAQKEGYVEYLWQWKDDESRVVPKLSFVKGIPEWEWIIGTGVYINDVEDEIALLSKNITIIFSFIAGLLILILTYVIFQSRRINNDLLKADAGLIEAKDRYKALVEASNEGHILEVEGENVYSNFTLQKMLGYSGKEISSMKTVDLLVPDSKVNEEGLNHLKKLSSGKTMSGEFEAQVLTKTGEILDVVITTARIFFLKKKGHVISVRKILRKKSNDMMISYSGNQYNPGSIFATKKVKDICRKTTEEDKSDTEKISSETPVFEALEVMKNSERDNLNVIDENGKIIGIVGYYDIAMMYSGLPTGMLFEIENSENVGHVIRTLNRLPDLIKEMTAQGIRSDTLRETISKMYTAAIKLFIKISLEESGEPPVKFAFLSLGSTARQEMTMFSDQDNALIFEDTQDIDKAKKYFIRFADKVCTKLNKAGYPFCPGGIMAVNPKWCLSLTEWKDNFTEWIENATPESILEINVFFDIRCDYGEEKLVTDLQDHIKEKTEQNPAFFINFAQNCLRYREPLNLLGRIKAESKDGAKTFNIKDNLIPIVNFGRLYALKNHVTEPSTVKRLHALYEKDILKDKEYHEIVYVFNHLWHLRFYNQIISHSELKKADNELDLEQLTDIERLNLRNVLAEISNFQARISSDFLDGTM